MKRKRPISDSRPDWRDPDMKVRFDKRAEGYDATKQKAASMLSLQYSKEPTYRTDPTYNMRKR